MVNRNNTNKLIENAIDYVDSLKLDDFEFCFSKSCSIPTLYSSVYACMIKGWTGKISNQKKKQWSDYLNEYQQPDGFYIDYNCLNNRYFVGDGWGARHLIPHMIIALQRLNSKPKYEFSFLEKMKTPDNVIAFLETLDFQKIWGTSNIIMNYGVTMQYARDFMGAPFKDSVIAMEEWLIKHIRSDCAMWQTMPINSSAVLYETIRGAYHIYPILLYDKVEIPGFEKVIPYLIKAQNSQGGFDKNINSSACDDIDAIDPLIRSSIISNESRKFKIRFAINRAKKNVLYNRNEDGGFVFDRKSAFKYGDAEQLFSKKNESNLFGTWFRLLSLILIDEYNRKPQKSKLLWLPGYELSIRG